VDETASYYEFEYVFPEVGEPGPINYEPADSNTSVCIDLELDADVIRYTMQFSAAPEDWLDWSGYGCNF